MDSQPFNEDNLQPENEQPKAGLEAPTRRVRRNPLGDFVNALLGLGLGESMLRVGTTLLTVLLVAAAVWLINQFDSAALAGLRSLPVMAGGGPTPTVFVDPGLIPPPIDLSIPGVNRLAEPHTNIPSRPRQEIELYSVVQGDSLFGIAEKFGLKPETILWGNYTILADDPHSLSPGQQLNILPVNGVYYQWVGGTSFEGWAEFFGVTAQDIIEYPGNHINPDTIGDYASPNIELGTWLIIPGGSRQLIVWSAPLGLTRDNAAIASEMGPGACGTISGGVVGYGTFVWPANKHYLSGYDYQPPIHWGIDIAGSVGEGVYASDAGVVVYAGNNSYGYGNMIMIDHGTGFQTLYAHLNEVYVSCGQSVGQGQSIGAIGSTGKSSGAHLHFEIRTTTYFVNPWDYLPPP